MGQKIGGSCSSRVTLGAPDFLVAAATKNFVDHIRACQVSDLKSTISASYKIFSEAEHLASVSFGRDQILDRRVR